MTCPMIRMTRSRTLYVLLPGLLVVLLFSACNRKIATTAVNGDAPTAPGSPSQFGKTPGESAPAQIPTTPRPAQIPQPVALGAPSGLLRDVYFDFDRATIRNDAKPLLREDAEFLKTHSVTKIRIEGHCDERGTVEYNLALGNRRADAVKRYLIDLGVEPSRISVISYGKEKPFCSEHNEACYNKNRRGHFVSLTPGN